MDSCIYCGERSQALDHVIPRSFLASGKRSGNPGGEPGFRVPACNQCNSILGAKIFDNLVERKKYVHTRLRVKLHKHDATVGWSAEEIAALGPNLRGQIEIAMAKREIARDRLRYSAGPPDARWLDMEERWREKLRHDPTIASLPVRERKKGAA